MQGKHDEIAPVVNTALAIDPKKLATYLVRLTDNLSKIVKADPALRIMMFASENSLTLLSGKLKVDEFSSQLSFSDGLIRTKGKGLIGGELFQISLNPKEWIDDQDNNFRVKLSHLDSETNFYVTKNLANQWDSVIESDNLQANISLIINQNGNYFVNLKDLNKLHFW